jgi:hypothetical protein
MPGTYFASRLLLIGDTEGPFSLRSFRIIGTDRSFITLRRKIMLSSHPRILASTIQYNSNEGNMLQMHAHDGEQICTSEIFANDVLLGRGTGPNEHMGNCIFREEVEKCRETYLSASINKAREEQILDGIISSIQQSGGRFLRKLDSQSDPAGKTVYEVVIDKKVLAYKIKQAIRYSKRRDQKMEANIDSKKPENAPKRIQSSDSIAFVGESQATSSALLPRARARTAITMTSNPWSHAAAVKDPSPAAHQSSHSPFGLAAAQQTKDLPTISQSQLRYPTFPPGNISNTTNFRRDQASNDMISNELLDHLALLYLQKVDPHAAQVVLEQRRQKQQSLQLGNSRLQQPFSFSANANDQQQQQLLRSLEPQSSQALGSLLQAQPERLFSSAGATLAQQHDYREPSYPTSSKDGQHSPKRRKTQQ